MATDSVQPSDGFTGSRPLPLLLLLLLSSWVRREIVLVLQLSAGNSARVTAHAADKIGNERVTKITINDTINK